MDSGRRAAIRGLLGVDPGAVTREHLQALADAGGSETSVLEFKAKPATDKQELAKDIAAMANAGGGVIVYGIAENTTGAPHTLTDVDISDGEHLRIRQTAYANIHPYPELEFFPIPSAADAGVGQYLLVVGGADGAPYAVSTPSHALLFVVRDGTGTRRMREPEVARRYRDRFGHESAQADRLEAIWQEGTQRIPVRGDVWLAVAAAPFAPGRLAMTADTASSARAWVGEYSRTRCPTPLSAGGSVSVGRRQVRFGDPAALASGSLNWLLDLHLDGSGFAALRVADGPQGHQLASAPVFPVTDVEVDFDLLTWLAILAGHAQRADSGGDLAVAAQLVGPRWNTQALVPVPGVGVRPAKGINVALATWSAVVDTWMPFGPRVTVEQPTRTVQTVPVSVADNSCDLVAAAGYLATDLVSEFGEPTPAVLRTDGALSLADVAGRWAESFNSWASTHDVPVVS